MHRSLLRSWSVLLALVAPAAAQGDDCLTPVPIAGLGTFPFDTTGNTTSGFSGQGACFGGSTSIFNDHIFLWTCPASGDYMFDLFGTTWNAELSAHLGNDCAATCQAWATYSGGLTYVHVYGATAGDEYLIQIGGTTTAQFGTGTLTVSADPCGQDDAHEDNDDCASAALISTGFHSNLLFKPDDWDFYRVPMQPGDTLTALCDMLGQGTFQVVILDENCVQLDIGGMAGAGQFSGTAEATNWSSAPQDFRVQIKHSWSMWNCTTYDLTLDVTPNPCFNPLNDGFEDNDSCATAVSITPGTYPGLVAHKAVSDNDYFLVSVPPNERLTADAFFNNSGGNINMFAWAPGCSNLLDSSTLGSNQETVEVVNTTSATIDVVVEVHVVAFDTNDCNGYDLVIDVSPHPCLGDIDDYLEENDNCSSSVLLPNGTYDDLFVSKFDKDHYNLRIDPGATIDVDVLFTDADGDIDIYLYGTGQCGAGPNGAIGAGESNSDNESVSFTNNSQSFQIYTVEVRIWAGDNSDCNSYSLTVDGDGNGALGFAYCSPAPPNSTGSSATITAHGSSVAAQNYLFLTAFDLPSNQFGYFLASEVQAFVPNPGGSQGNLCIGGSHLARFTDQIGQVAGGILSIRINTQNVPANPVQPILAGETWNFQCWFRDFNPTPTSNFTNGASVLFQ